LHARLAQASQLEPREAPPNGCRADQGRGEQQYDRSLAEYRVRVHDFVAYLGRGYVIIGWTLVVLALTLLGLGSYALAVLWPR